MNRYLTSFVGVAGVMGWLSLAVPAAPADPPEIAVIRPDLRTGFANAGWKYDRYQDLPSLDAHKTIPAITPQFTTGTRPCRVVTGTCLSRR
jgi:hypothetical protein